MDTCKLIEVTRENLASSHICCAIGSGTDAKAGSLAKKNWMNTIFDDGYRFHRMDARGKVLIETIPGENAWCPIEANNWLFIDCFWVSGSFKGQGIANRLFEIALERAKQEHRYGVCALSSDKKRPFLSDPGFYRHKGLTIADTAPPYYQLLALPFSLQTPLPRFSHSVATATVPQQGLCLWYSEHCPHTTKYAGLLADAADKRGVVVTLVKVDNRSTAQKAPNPFPTWAMFWKGNFITNEIFSLKKFNTFLNNNLNFNTK